MEIKNAVFRNVPIVYDGGPLWMTNVYFINCTFAMKQNRDSQNLAVAVLDPNLSTPFARPPPGV
jgi:hypothetical protein